MKDQDILLMMQQGHLPSEVLRRYREGLLNSDLMRAVKVFLAANPLYADAAEGIEAFEDEAALEASLNLLEKRREKLLKGRSNVTYLRFEWIQRAALLAAAVAMIGITSFVIQWFGKDARDRRAFADLKQQENHVTVVQQDTLAAAQARQLTQAPVVGHSPHVGSSEGDVSALSENIPLPAAEVPTREAQAQGGGISPLSPRPQGPPAASPVPTLPSPANQPVAASTSVSPREEALSEAKREEDAEAYADDAPSLYNANGRARAQSKEAAAPPVSAPIAAGAAAGGSVPDSLADTADALLARAEQLLARQDTARAIPLLERAARSKEPAGKKAAERLRKIRKKE